jgi:hypothetical protein
MKSEATMGSRSFGGEKGREIGGELGGDFKKDHHHNDDPFFIT